MGDMIMKQCDKGHFYDDNRFDTCPYCKDGTGLGKQAFAGFQNQPVPQFQPAAPQPAVQQFKFCTKCGNRVDFNAKFCIICGNAFAVAAPSPTSDIGKTVAVMPMAPAPTSDIGKTVAVQPMSAFPSPTSDIGKTVAVQPMASFQAPASDIGKTVALKPMDIEIPAPAVAPVVAPAVAPVAPVAPVGPADGPTVAPAVAPVNVPAAAPAVAPVDGPTVAPAIAPAEAPVTAPAAAPVSEPAASNVCPNCGFERIPGASFCTNCGKKFGSEPEAKAEPVVEKEELPSAEPAVAPVVEPAVEPDNTKPVAFLVCVSGGNPGDFYAVTGGKNYITGGDDSGIKLDKDEAASANCYSVITYDPSGNLFTLSAGSGLGITYINEDQVDTLAEIKAYDRIKAGTCELLFVPVCSDKFKWDARA